MALSRNRTLYRVAKRCGATSLLAILAAPILAQPPDTSQSLAIEEIIVTATRRASSQQDIPFSIMAISGELLERQNLMQLPELSRQVPGLTVVDQGPRAASRMTARGLNVASLNESAVLFNSSGNTVATYLGEIPIYVDFRMWDLERVEVLLGPQGTLYGAGTLGGAIRYIPGEPVIGAWEASIAAGAFGQDESSGSGADIRAILNAPLVDDKLALRLSVSRYVDPGFTDYPVLLREPGTSNPQPDFSDPADVAANLYSSEDLDGGELWSARAALKWDISPRVSATLNYYHQDTDFGGRSVNHQQSVGSGRFEAASRVPEPNERKNQLISLELKADLGFAEFVSATGVSQYEELGQRDQTDLVLPLGFGFEDFPNFVDITSDETTEDRINQELRLISSGPGPWSWIAGAYYNDFEFNHELNEFAPGYAEFLGTVRPDNLLYVIQIEKKRTEAAVFGELAYDINDQWQLSLGGRSFHYDTVDSEGTDLPLILTAAGIYGPDDINVNMQTFEDEDSGTLFKFSTSYRIDDDLMSYLTISEGYRVGGTNAAPRCPDTGPGLLPCLRPDETTYQPDTTLNYEIGARSTWLGGRLTLNAAIYYIDWNDVQLDVLSEDFFFITVNGGTARSRGIELSSQAVFNDSWSAAFGYAFNSAELTSTAPGAVDGEDGLAGDRLAGTPEHQFSAMLTYNRLLGKNWELDLDYGFTYSGDIFTKTGLRSNGEILPGYAVHNVAANFATQTNWSFRLYVQNLLDEFAETNTRSDPSFIRNIGVHPLRLYYRNVLQPRRYGFEVRYDFVLN